MSVSDCTNSRNVPYEKETTEIVQHGMRPWPLKVSDMHINKIYLPFHSKLTQKITFLSHTYPMRI